MSNVFAQNKPPVRGPNRNTFDLSFANNFTTKIGQLTPVMCKEVLPGDTFKIDSAFALRFMPLQFPLQTKLTATLHYFYVRNRNLYDDWPEFIGKTKDGLVPPYLNPDNTNKSSTFGTGKLADYLGVPSTVVGDYGAYDVNVPIGLGSNVNRSSTQLLTPVINADIDGKINPAYGKLIPIGSSFLKGAMPATDAYLISTFLYRSLRQLNYHGSSTTYTNNIYGQFTDKITQPMAEGQLIEFSEVTGMAAATVLNFFVLSKNVQSSGQQDDEFVTYGETYNMTYDSTAKSQSHVATPALCSHLNAAIATYGYARLMICLTRSATASSYSSFGLGQIMHYRSSVPHTVDGSDVSTAIPFIRQGGSMPDLPISALPFRAYESIYNCYYRNQQNDPLLINGVPEYNKYLTNTSGGGDTFNYTLHFRNWQQDYLTSCVQSPQQGIAPLVGLTVQSATAHTADLEFKDVNDNIYRAQVALGDNDDISAITYVHNTTDDSRGVPAESIQTLMDMVTRGISINDLRNVNSFQRWLECNIRQGFRYKDQIKSHFGVEAHYNVLDMPEFLGGIVQNVDINTISQTVETSDSPLGAYAGQASCIGKARHGISQYCDEHGFIMAILCVTPQPCYSQVLPKMFTKKLALDYFFPEFGHIGLQPVPNAEVCPIQTYLASPNELNKVFGYQRAWYDYLSSIDEVHGQFRTSLSNYLMMRTFDTKPELGGDFIKIDPNQVNDVFSYTDGSDDKVLGQVYFDIIAKRPIPRYGIPKLE